MKTNEKNIGKSKTKYSPKGTKIPKFLEIHHITVYSNPIASRKTVRVSPDRSFISGENFELFHDGGNTYCRGGSENPGPNNYAQSALYRNADLLAVHVPDYASHVSTQFKINGT